MVWQVVKHKKEVERGDSSHHRTQHAEVVQPELQVGDEDDAQYTFDLHRQERPEDYDKDDDEKEPRKEQSRLILGIHYSSSSAWPAQVGVHDLPRVGVLGPP